MISKTHGVGAGEEVVQEVAGAVVGAAAEMVMAVAEVVAEAAAEVAAEAAVEAVAGVLLEAEVILPAEGHPLERALGEEEEHPVWVKANGRMQG